VSTDERLDPEADVAAAYKGAGAFWVFGYFGYRSLLDERLEYRFLVKWDLAFGFISENRAGYT